jgi:WD40 repeat protein
LIVSCGTDGEIHKWKITQADLIVYENFTFKNKDRRTINKINFHPREKDLLISGDQDGIINLLDFRSNNNPVSTFNIDKDEKVTE